MQAKRRKGEEVVMASVRDTIRTRLSGKNYEMRPGNKHQIKRAAAWVLTTKKHHDEYKEWEELYGDAYKKRVMPRTWQDVINEADKLQVILKVCMNPVSIAYMPFWKA